MESKKKLIIIVGIIVVLIAVLAVFLMNNNDEMAKAAAEESIEISTTSGGMHKNNESFYITVHVRSDKYDESLFDGKPIYVNLTDDNGTVKSYNLTLNYSSVNVEDLDESTRYNVTVYFPGGDGLPAKYFSGYEWTSSSFTLTSEGYGNPNDQPDTDSDSEVSDEPVVDRPDTDIAGRNLWT